MPKRIQMTRQRPWRAEHPDAVIVARPSKWGNPFAARIPHFGGLSPVETRALLVEQYRLWLDGMRPAEVLTRTPALVYPDGRVFIAEVRAGERPRLKDIRAELAGRDLACWCPLDQPCHADVLLEIANADPS